MGTRSEVIIAIDKETYFKVTLAGSPKILQDAKCSGQAHPDTFFREYS